MDDLLVVRHGESETAARAVVGGDAPLTSVGRAQAHELGRALTALPIDVCLTSSARRARETASIALEGRDLPVEIMRDLADIAFGVFDGRPLAEYREWVAAHRPDESPSGGESRADTLRRLCRVYRTLLGRLEEHVLVIAHGLTLSALTDDPPLQVVAGVPYGSMLALDRGAVEAAVVRLERWCEAPTW